MKYLFDRAVAYIIDCTICYAAVMLIIQWALLSHLRENIGITDEWFRDSLHLEIYVLLTISLPVWLYFTWMDSERSKGTIGKRIMGLRVYKEGQPVKLSLGTSFIRTLCKLLPWEIAHLGVIFPVPMYFADQPGIRWLTILGIVLFGVYLISISLSEKNQSIYDRLLGTRVVKQQN